MSWPIQPPNQPNTAPINFFEFLSIFRWLSRFYLLRNRLRSSNFIIVLKLADI